MKDYPKMMMTYESGLDYKTTMDTRVRTKAQNDTLGTNIYHAHLLMYKLIIKLLEIKNQSKRYKEPKNGTKIGKKKFHKKMHIKGL